MNQRDTRSFSPSMQSTEHLGGRGSSRPGDGHERGTSSDPVPRSVLGDCNAKGGTLGGGIVLHSAFNSLLFRTHPFKPSYNLRFLRPPRLSGTIDPRSQIPDPRILLSQNSPSLNSGTPRFSNSPDAIFPNLKQSQNPRPEDSDPQTAQASISSSSPTNPQTQIPQEPRPSAFPDPILRRYYFLRLY